jgi:hypothetical protein
MAEFPTAVQPPGGASYAPPLMNFSNFSNWAADDPYKLPTEKAKLEQIQQQIELSKAFAGGLPTDPQTGQIDYRKAAGILAAKGDIGGAVSLLQQQPAPLPAIMGGQPQGGQPAPQAAPQGQPSSVQARPLPPPGRGPQGDAGTGTVTSLVTDRLPAQNQTTGETIMKIAQVMGIDPNANLTPGQVIRAQGLLKKYAPEIAGSGAMSFSDRFRGDSGGDQGGGLPPSANAGTPAATAAPPAQGSRPQGGQPAAQQPQAQGQPLVPQEPLPPGYNDPIKAIADLRSTANQLAADPRPNAQAMAQRADAWAQRIEAGLKPVSVGVSTTLVDPRTAQPIYQGPAAAAYGSGGGETGATLDADANQYRMTGKLPPNMGRGIQGQQQATAIRTRAAEQEVTEGGDPNDWPTRWQHFTTQAAGLRTLETRAAGLSLAENEASSLIPRVREASAKVSRTQYPNINSLILAAKKGTGGTDVIKLGVAVESLIPVYAKILKPVGTVGAADMERAHDILEKKWSDGQINAALDQMEVELKSARAALDKTMEEFGTKKKRGGTESDASKAGSSTSKSSTYQNTTPDGFGWSIEK